MATPRTSLPGRAAVTIADQCVASGSNFAVAVIIARIAGPAGLGAYSLAYASWLFISSVHRAVITDPMAITGDARPPADVTANLRRGFAAECTLGLMSGSVVALLGLVLLAAHQSSFGTSQLAVAAWVPFLLLQDYWRWIGFMKAAPQKALANDILFDVVQAAGFAVLVVAHVHSASLAITAWGLGALAGAVYGMWQFRVIPAFRPDSHWIRQKWSVSRWLAATSVSSWGLNQLYVVLTGAILGPVGLGGLKAAQGLVSGPAFVLVQAGGSLGLPEASKAYHEKGLVGLHRVARFVTAAGIASVGLVFLVVLGFGRKLLDVLYGAQFGRYAPAAVIIAVAYVLTSLALGAVLKVKATRQVRPLFTLSLVGVVASVAAVLVLAPWWGVSGAAAAYTVGTAAYVGGLLIVARHLKPSSATPGPVRDIVPGADCGELADEHWDEEVESRLRVLRLSIRQASMDLESRTSGGMKPATE